MNTLSLCTRVPERVRKFVHPHCFSLNSYYLDIPGRKFVRNSVGVFVQRGK